MGAVQKLATTVIVGLTGLATVLVFYLADEQNRRHAETDEKDELAIERGVQTYITNCLVCHGPAGEGSYEVDAEGNPLRVGKAIGGNTPERLINQSEDPVIRAEREQIIRTRIHGGSPIGCSTIYPTVQCAMPPWGSDYGGEFNDEMIEELVLMIQHVDWDLVYNHAVDPDGDGTIEAGEGEGYPTPPVAPEATEAPTDGDGPPTFTLEGVDIGWRTADQPGPQVEFAVAPGTVIDLPNAGASAHNFTIDAKNNDGLPDLGISVDMPVGDTATATIPAEAAPGTYYFYCNVPGHEAGGMWGRLTVDPNAAPAGGAAAPPEATPGAAPAATPEASPAPAPGASPAAPPAASPAATPGTAPQQVVLEAYDIGWKLGDQPGPTVAFAVAAGGTVKVVNSGDIAHNFTIDALGLGIDPLPGETIDVPIPADTPPGDYEFVCAVPGHAEGGMRGTITVAAGGAATPAAATPAAATPAAGDQGATTDAVQVEAFDIGWRTADQPGPEIALEVAPGATIDLVNTGVSKHNFDLQALGVFVDLAPGGSGQAAIPDDAPPGNYEFVCSIPGHSAIMKGTLTIR